MTRRYSRRVLVDLVVAAYENIATDDAWLKRLYSIAEPVLDTGHGSLGYFVNASARRVYGMVGDPLQAAVVGPMHELRGPTAWEVYFQPRVTTGRRYFGDPTVTKDIERFLGRSAGDIWGVACVDARGRGIVLTAPQGRRRELPLGARAWTMAAVHIATAWRLRMSRRSKIEAVLDPAGKLLHREPSAAGSESALIDAVLRRARSIDSDHTSSEDALTAWRTLTNGQWTIVDDVQADGKRYLVARRNELDTSRAGLPRSLTRIEAQVCAMAAAAHSQKLIAYELGIHASAVSRHLMSGMHKLGVRSLPDLARRFAWLPTPIKR